MKITSNTSSFMSKNEPRLSIALNHVELLRMKTLQSSPFWRRTKVSPCDMTLTQPTNCHLTPTSLTSIEACEAVAKTQPNQKKIEWPHLCLSEFYFRLIFSLVEKILLFILAWKSFWRNSRKKFTNNSQKGKKSNKNLRKKNHT